MDNNYEQAAKYFENNVDLYIKLVELNQKKDQLKRIRGDLGKLQDPIIITLCGTPRSGKTSCITSLYEFLKKQDFKTSYIMEPAGIIYDTLNSKEEKKRLLEDRVKFVDMQFDVGLNKINEYINNSEIIICDRGIIDTFIWYDMYYKMGLLSDSEYDQKISKSQILKNFINYFYVLYSDSFESMRRDFNCTLSLEPRSTINDYFISNYNESLKKIYSLLSPKLSNSLFIDTTTYEIMDASIELSNDIMDNVKKLYLNK